ncbi:hypothetical protein CC79DRAFT_1399662 [Sarocladium strictum]
MRLVIALLFAGALASPVQFDDEEDISVQAGSGYQPCSKSGFFGNAPTCCSTDFLGAASLGCTPPARNPRSPQEFKALCGAKKPKCCFIDPVGGIVNAICPNPIGF